MNRSVSELEARELERLYFSVYILNIPVYYQNVGEELKKREVMMFVGKNLMGDKRYIASVFRDKYTLPSEWYGYFQELKRRGMEEVLYLIGSKEKDEKVMEAFKLCYTNVEIMDDCHEAINKVYKYIPVKNAGKFIVDIKHIYLAETLDSYELKLKEMKEEYKEYDFIMDPLYNNLEEIKKNYKYDFEFRSELYSFYFMREFIKKLKTNMRKKEYIMSIEEYLEANLKTIQGMETHSKRYKEVSIRIIKKLYKEKGEMIKSYL